jgi:hypothetical protein
MGRGLTILKRLKWFAIFLVMGACIDTIHFDAQPPGDIIVLDGSITTDAGPYVITMSRGLRLDSDSTINAPVVGATIVLHSDKGETETFVERKPGEYHTGSVIRGTIGSTYHIALTMPDGATFESEPETIMPSGEVRDIHYQYEARTVEKYNGPQPADVFNIFIDASSLPTEDKTSYVRWRFTGTYVMETNPEQHTRWLQGASRYLDPWPCSGWEVEPALGGGKLVQKRPCTCCRCWVTQYEASPRLSDTDLVEAGEFRNLTVAEVPVTRLTFFEKYQVAIEQMTLSKNAFDFFKVVRTQKDGASNLFQPPPGKLTGNIKPVNANYEIVGLFWGASVHRKAIYIPNTELPYKIPRDIIQVPCNTSYTNSSNVQPADWIE